MSNRSAQQLLDDRLEALGRFERRRLLLRLSAVSAHGDSHIDFSEFDRDDGTLDPLVTMRHLHLPVLEEGGFVRWDRQRHRVTKGPRFDELEPFLRLLRELRDEPPNG